MTQKRMNKSQNKIELKIKAGWVIQLFTLEGWNKSVPWLAKNRLVYCHKIAKFHNQGTCDRHISRSSGWRLGKIKSLRVSKQFLPSETIRRVFDYLTQENRGELATVAFKILFRVSRPWLLIECIGISRWASWTSRSGTRGLDLGLPQSRPSVELTSSRLDSGIDHRRGPLMGGCFY